MKTALATFLMLFTLAASISAQSQYRSLKIGDDATIDVQISPSDLEVMEDEEMVLWTPGRNVRSATYENYYFSLEDFLENIGDPAELKESISVRIYIERIENSTSQNLDPMMQQPDGGFTYANYGAAIIELL